ncbi:YceI family protein [Rhodohalobacter sp. 8-1]|uniref:YceI family protein n=1 Tax=Rhodohalobacter sp. 8-1 TaxID=3131972 RepID=UPI0030ECB9E4
MIFTKGFILIFLLTLLAHQSAEAQATDSSEAAITNTTLLENSSMTIKGSSTLHGWTVEATDFSVQFSIPNNWFQSDDNWNGSDIDTLAVTVPVEHLDGGRNKMNRDLREALRFEAHPQIRFTWDEIGFTGQTGIGKSATVTGSVTVAGVQREIEFGTDIRLNEWNQIVAKGSVTMNMTDYNIEPPTALFGVIRTDEKIELMFELYFEKENQG